MAESDNKKDKLPENIVSLSEAGLVGDIDSKLSKARRLLSLHEYASCEELVRQVLQIDPENPKAKALLQLTALKHPDRKLSKKIVEPQLTGETQDQADRVETQWKSSSFEVANSSLGRPRRNPYKRIVEPQLPGEAQNPPDRIATQEPVSSQVLNTVSSEFDSQLSNLEGAEVGKEDDRRGHSKSENLWEDASDQSDLSASAAKNIGPTDLRQKTIATLVEFLKKKDNSLPQPVPEETPVEGSESILNMSPQPHALPSQRETPSSKIDEEPSFEKRQEEAKSAQEQLDSMHAVTSAESQGEDHLRAAISYYHEKKLREALIAAQKSSELTPDRRGVKEFADFVAKRLTEEKKKKRWAIAMLLLWILVALIILALPGRDSNNKRQSKPPSSDQSTLPNGQRANGSDTAREAASSTTQQQKSLKEDGFPKEVQLSPEEVVKTFYTRAAAGDFAGAWKLAGPGFRRQLKGFEQFKNAQESLQSIQFLRAEMTSQTSDRTYVAIETVAVHTNRTEHCKASFSLVRRANGGWLLNWANGLRCDSQPRSTVSSDAR